MAKTPFPLFWEFYREVEGAKGLGSVVHYFNEEAQSIYLNEGLTTRTSVELIEKGHWREKQALSDEIKITDDPWTILRMDHASNSCLYGAVTDGKTLSFIRYTYGLDLTTIMNSWNWVLQIDNTITQLNGSVQNINPTIFGSESSLLQPGGRITTFIQMGDSEAYPIGVVWLDEVKYDDRSDTINTSGRNTIGYYLKDQTFDGDDSEKDNPIDAFRKYSNGEITYTFQPEVKNSEGVVTTEAVSFKQIIEAILKYAGVDRFMVQEREFKETDKKQEFKFRPSDNLLSGIQNILDFFLEPPSETTNEDGSETVNQEHAWEIAELPDGTICVGRDDWISTYLPKGFYIFDEGKDVFTRKTLKSSDGAYTSLRVTGKDTSGNDLTPVTVDVESYKYWALGKHKTKHIQAPDGKTQDELGLWAKTQAKKYQYVGITEDLTSPFRPQLLVGDIAVVKHGDKGTVLGTITEVRHSFGIKDGFKTDFSVDSGGYAFDKNGVNIDSDVDLDDFEIDITSVYSRAAQVEGFNRKQRLVDAVRRATNR